MPNHDQINLKDFMIGAVVGVALGATIALLTAPKRGREVRDDINKGINYVKDKGQEVVQGIKDQSDEVVGKLTEAKSKVQSKWTELKENSKEGITEILLEEDEKAADNNIIR